jgi:hypothetical protein
MDLRVCIHALVVLCVCSVTKPVYAANFDFEEWFGDMPEFPPIPYVEPYKDILMNPKSWEWEIVPHSEWWNEVDSRMVIHEDGDTHWYEYECCNNHDCHGFDQSLVRVVQGGVILMLPRYKDFGATDVFFPEEQFLPRPKGSTGDGLWHLCFTVTRHRVTGEWSIGRRCVYPPSPST